MIQLRPATDADARAWQSLLAATPSGDFLHDWAWADVAAFDGQPQRRYVLEDDGAIVAIVAAQARPLRAVGVLVRAARAGPRLRRPARGRTGAGLDIGLRAVAREHRAIAVKLEPRLEQDDPRCAFEAAGLRQPDTLQVGQTRIVELAERRALLAGFDKDTRYSVRRAEREGVEVSRHRGRRRNARSTTPRPGGRDAAPRRLPDAAARALSDRLARPGRRRSGRHPRGAARGRAAGVGDARHRGRPVLLPVQRLAPRGAWRAEALRQLRAAVGDDAARPRSRAPATTTCGASRRPAGAEHPWHGVGLFKKGFGGREVHWAGCWDLVVDPTLYRLRAATGIARGWLRGLRR